MIWGFRDPHRAALTLTLTLLVASPGRAATIHVPGDQPTIQAGVVGTILLVGSYGPERYLTTLLDHYRRYVITCWERKGSGKVCTKV